MMPGRQNTVKC